jgi:hypothetical protein
MVETNYFPVSSMCSLIVVGVAQNITGWRVVKLFYHITTKFLQLQRSYWFKVPIVVKFLQLNVPIVQNSYGLNVLIGSKSYGLPKLGYPHT